jgi:hypothetical protein
MASPPGDRKKGRKAGERTSLVAPAVSAWSTGRSSSKWNLDGLCRELNECRHEVDPRELVSRLIVDGRQHMVERSSRNITADRLRRGVFTSVPELITGIEEYIDHHNTNPKLFLNYEREQLLGKSNSS